MLIINPYIFKQIPGIVFGLSTKSGLKRAAPYYFNMSFTVGDDPQIVTENRKAFFSNIGLSIESVAYQNQVHDDHITFVEKGGEYGDSDAMITDRKNLGLAISTADCCAIFLFDPIRQIIAAVHSGWRGTKKKILSKVLDKLFNEFNSDPTDLVCYLSPSISQQNYEIGAEVASQFDPVYVQSINEKSFLNIPEINYNILVNFGVRSKNIQTSKLCTYEYSSILHSYRRDGLKSGRALGVIAMRGKE